MPWSNMTPLYVVVVTIIIVSFICSLLEAIILSVTGAYIQTLIERKHRAGPLLQRLKQRINDPITAILTVNTIANSAGAAIAGSIALEVLGSRWVAAFSALLTLAILLLSEIIPKTVGATYWKQLAPFATYVIWGLVAIARPVVLPANFLARLIARGRSAENVTREDVLSAIRLGRLQGVLESSEFGFLSSILHLKDITIGDIMTPRTVVYGLPPEATSGDVVKNIELLHYSRLPLYDKKKNRVEGIVLRRDIIMSVARDKPDTPLRSLSAAPLFIPETQSVYMLLDRLIAQRVHLAVVLNEFGDFVGVATMEDAIESLLGREIVDESDRVTDMRELARQKLRERLQNDHPG
jgi:CBS domain containing-hemolysin-like protein